MTTVKRERTESYLCFWLHLCNEQAFHEAQNRCYISSIDSSVEAAPILLIKYRLQSLVTCNEQIS